jgi:hypothetical protein
VKYELATTVRSTRTVLSKTLHILTQDEGISRKDIVVLTVGSVAGSSLSETTKDAVRYVAMTRAESLLVIVGE